MTQTAIAPIDQVVEVIEVLGTTNTKVLEWQLGLDPIVITASLVRLEELGVIVRGEGKNPAGLPIPVWSVR